MKHIRIGLSLAWIGVLISGLVLIGCSGSPGGEIVYYEETKILTEEEAENIEEVTGNRSSILFSETTAFVAGLEPGDILVYDEPLPGAEHGLLERVISVSPMADGFLEVAAGLANGGTVVEIEPATMVDAIEEGNFSVNATIPIEDLMSDLMWATGVEVLQISGGEAFTYYPAEGVTIEGYLRFTADSDVHIEVDILSGLQEFEFVFSPELEMMATVTVEAGTTWDKKYDPLVTISGPPIPIWGPVSVTPKAALVVGTTGTLEASFEASVTYERGYDVGLSYDRSRPEQWQMIRDMHGEGVDPGEPSFSGHAEARVFGGVELSATTGIGVAEVGLGVGLFGNIRASGEAQLSPWQWQYDLELYLSAQVFAHLKLLGIAPIRWDSPPWESSPYNLAYGASGRVTTEGDEGLADVEISFSGGYSSVTTDEDGYWHKHLLMGDVEATPDKPGYSFDPPSRTVTGSASNLDFVVPTEEQPLEITADSDSKPYDGTSLTDSGYSITSGTLLPGHSLVSVTVTGSQTDVGSSSNIPSNAVIMDGGDDVTSSYDITYVNGTLTVTGTVGYATEYVDQDSFVWEMDPNYNFDSYSIMRYGEYPEGYRNRVYLKFDFDDVAIPGNAVVDWARLYIHIDNWIGTYFGYTESHRVLGPWSETAITWNNKPNCDPDNSGGKSILNYDTGWHYLMINSLVRNWIDGTYDNYGLCLLIDPNSGLLATDSRATANGAYIYFKWQTP